MSCYILNGTDGRLSNEDIVEKLFGCENTSSTVCEKGAKNDLGQKHCSYNGASVIWHVKNKYYEADVRVYVSSDLISTQIKIPPVGAIVYYTDKVLLPSDPNTENNAKEFIAKMETWLNSHSLKLHVNDLSDNQKTMKVLLDREEPDSEDVRLIVVESFASEDLKSATLSWALDKGIEVIDSDEEDENDAISTLKAPEIKKEDISGLRNKRLLEALQTFPWNSVKKDVQSNEKSQDADEGSGKNPDSVEGDFEELLSKLSTFKQASDELPQNERYAFAEQIALSFYSAMGGEEEESDSVE